jgi:hypothetical protein
MGDAIKISERVEGSSAACSDEEEWIAGEPKRFSIGAMSHEIRKQASENIPNSPMGRDGALFYL